MNVEETKRLILARLEAMRAARENAPPIVPTSCPPESRRRRWRLFGGGPHNGGGIESRLASLEDRLVAMERIFLQGARPTGPNGAGKGRKPAGGSERAAAVRDVGGAGSEDGETYRLTGDVHDGLITDVLQMLASNQKSGRFSLFLPERETRFDLVFVDGEVVHATAGELEGEAAFFSLMTMAHQEGHYGFLETEVGETPKTITQKTQYLILEALRRIDEELQGVEKSDAAG